MEKFNEIKNEIENANSIIVMAHENPDGDAVGSVIAMYLMLKNLGKDVDAVMHELPRTFNYLEGFNEVKKESTRDNYDLAISLDCATEERLADNNKCFEKANRTIVIDHHGTNTKYGNVNYVEADSPACCQILVEIFDSFGWKITKEIGSALITGIITDTGGFQYSNTNEKTFNIAAELLSDGVNISEIYTKAYNTKSKVAFELQRRATDRLEFYGDNKVSFTYITKQDDDELNYEPGDHEGIVDIGRQIEGVEVSIFLREEEDCYKLSLRSNSYVDVSEICSKFNGGGHFRAAGAKITDMSFDEIKTKIIEEVVNHL